MSYQIGEKVYVLTADGEREGIVIKQASHDQWDVLIGRDTYRIDGDLVSRTSGTFFALIEDTTRPTVYETHGDQDGMTVRVPVVMTPVTIKHDEDVTFGDNKVELIETYGGDLRHALSAWTSTSRDLTEEKRGRIGKMLAQLAKDGHHTPFEKSKLHFLVTTDIATHIHFLKHRIGVEVNAESARYRELKDKAYLPADWPEELLTNLRLFIEDAQERYHIAVDHLVKHHGFDRKRAKESARFYLPYASQITADVAFNWRSFWHFLTLRYHENAQLEVRECARRMLELIVEVGDFQLTLEAFGLIKNGVLRPPFRKGEFVFVPTGE